MLPSESILGTIVATARFPVDMPIKEAVSFRNEVAVELVVLVDGEI